MVRASLKPSRFIAAALASVHSAAGASLVSLDLALGLKLAIAAAIMLSFAHALWRYALLKSRRSITAIELADRENVTLQTNDAVWRGGRVLGTSYVSPLLTVINVRQAEHKLAQHVIIVPHNIDAEDFRKLRVILRWSRPSSGLSDSRVSKPFA
ncbi:MAG: protein YgfX [Burkholderiales bacterium]